MVLVFTFDTARLSPVFGKSPGFGRHICLSVILVPNVPHEGTHFSAPSLSLTVLIPHVE